jgi:hypothetical protein
MSDWMKVTDNMIRAATNTGKALGLFAGDMKREDVAAMLEAVLQVMPRAYEPRYPFLIRERGSATATKARIIEMGMQPGYFRIEMEDGRALNIHANEFVPQRSTARKEH